MGQVSVPHSVVSIESPIHKSLASESTLHSLTLDLVPPPQLTEHFVHSVHSVQYGQFCNEHSLTSLFSPGQFVSLAG